MTMKLQVVMVTCVVMLVAADMASAAGCDILQLLPCSAAAKDAAVMPSKQCCDNVGKIGLGTAGAQCLCNLLSSQTAKAQGVVPSIALGIPQKCNVAVPKGFVCADPYMQWKLEAEKEFEFPEAKPEVLTL